LIYRVGNYQKGEQQLMHEWIAEHTANDAVFLASPGDVSFLSEAHRSLLIGYKAVIHEPYFLIPWAANFQRIYDFNWRNLNGQSPFMAAIDGFNRRPYIPLPTEKLDYRLDDLRECKFPDQLGKVVHREGNYILTEVPSPNKQVSLLAH
jgi:hypothetical protein